MRKLQYSQNFIKSKELVDDLIRKVGIRSSHIVLEIGTGTGTITQRLCMIAYKVISIEKDNKLLKAARKNVLGFRNLTLINQDFLHYSLPKSEYVCFSNIPFDHTADIIRKLLLGKNPPIAAHLFIQKESAYRFLGRQKQSNQLSLLLAPLYRSEIVYHFKRPDFSPLPSVEIVLVSFQKRFLADIGEYFFPLFQDFIIFAFNQWNSTVRKTLMRILSYRQLHTLSRDLCFDINARPSQLNYSQWLELFTFIQTHQNQVKVHQFKGYRNIHLWKHLRQKTVHRTSIKRNCR